MNIANGDKMRVATRRKQSERSLNAFLAVTIALLSVFLFANAMTKKLEHDEHMYCTAGYLMARGEVIYRDFSYVAQLPCHPLILALLYKITGTGCYLLVGRIFSVICEIGIVVCIAGICKSVLRRFPVWATVFAAGAVVIYSMNPFVIYTCGFAWNHTAVILCVLVCLWLFADMDFDRMNFLRLFAIGAILTLAACMRPTTVLVYAVFAVSILLVAPGRFRKGKVTALPFVMGSLAFAAWPLMVIARAPEAFFLNVVRVPALNSDYLRQIGWVYNKAHLTGTVLSTPAYIGLIVLCIYLGVMFFAARGTFVKSDKLKGVFFAVVAATFVTIAFIPPTMWLQYWGVPVAFVVVTLAYPVNHLCICFAEDMRKRHYLIITAILVITATAAALYEGLPSVISSVVNVTDMDMWVPVQVHKISQYVNRKTVIDGPILTLGPLYAIEGGGEIYPEFSAGPFVYRIADRLNDSQKRIVHAAGPDDLNKLIESRMPSAVILGTEPKRLEEPILELLTEANWEREIYNEKGPVVYFRKHVDGPPSSQ